VQEEVNKELQGAKINYGGLFFKNFLVTPQF